MSLSIIYREGFRQSLSYGSKGNKQAKEKRRKYTLRKKKEHVVTKKDSCSKNAIRQIFQRRKLEVLGKESNEVGDPTR